MSTSEDTGLLCEWLPPAESEGEEEEEAMFYAQERKVEGEGEIIIIIIIMRALTSLGTAQSSDF